jgi:hypothetical protein
MFVFYLTMLSVLRLYRIDDKMKVNMEQFVEVELAGETEVLGEKLTQWCFVHHKSHAA